MNCAAVLLAVLLATPAAAAPPEATGDAARERALAYLEDGNRLWAVKTLLEALEETPRDLQTRTWAVWLLLADGDTRRAQHLLDTADVPADGPMAGRVALLDASMARVQGDDEAARALVEEIGDRDRELFAEDLRLFDDLRQELTGNPGQPLGGRVILGGGYTTNAIQSAPQDAGAGLDRAGSALLAADGVIRAEPWVSPHARPLAEGRIKALAPLGEVARGLGYVDLAGRAGGEFGATDGFRLRLLYSYEVLALRDSGWSMVAHRGELEADVAGGLQVFVGAGRRIYTHLPRTRTEVDGGVAAVLPLGRGWNLTGVVAGRVQQARNEAFHDRGLTGLVRLRIPLPHDAMIKARVLGSVDVFPYSEAYYGLVRRDAMIRIEAGPWTPPVEGWRIGAVYGLTHRNSSVDNATDAFSYTDHRFLVQFRWEGSLDPRRPRRARPGRGHQALPYGLAGDDSGLDRVQDLLRQEDGARRGSQCVD
jgi:hypothetical protein